jgi:probable phosphoglycerate mutase
MTQNVVVFTDGGCRSNPGAGSFGYVIEFSEERKVTGGGFLDRTTNNFAELTAIAEAAACLLGLDDIGQEVQFRSDSMLCVKTLNGDWNLKEPSLRPVYELALGRIARLMARIPKVSIVWIPRELNLHFIHKFW